MTIHWKAVEQYFTVVLFVLSSFIQFVNLKNLSVLDLELSRAKGLRNTRQCINKPFIARPQIMPHLLNLERKVHNSHENV